MIRRVLLAAAVSFSLGFAGASVVPRRAPARAVSCEPKLHGSPLCDEGMVDGWMSCAYAFQSQLCPALKIP